MKLSNSLILLMCLFSLSAQAQNLVNSQSWTIGSGSVGIFSANGSASENIREMGAGPDGAQTILWKAIPDGGANADGGWDTEWFTIDRTKMYRFSVWIKKTNSTGGITYFGCSSNDILSLSGSVNSNPYFWSGDLPELNKWFLLVGYIHGSGDPSTSHYGGIYDGETGAKVLSINDFKFSVSATTARHRTYLYYDPNTSDRQYFYGPEVYQVEANQPLIETITSTLTNGNAFFSKKVGIGTTNPSGNFHIHSASTEMYLTSDDWGAIRGNGSTWLFGYNGTAGNEDISLGTQDNSGSRTLTFAAGGTARMKILSNGNVGIGTPNPNEALTVNGTIYGKEIKVDLSVPGADYVFEKDYKLLSLTEIEKYILEYKHLPEVPSAKEMEMDGINLSEMNMILLKKIEELTLHLIDQNRIIREQSKRIIDLENKLY